MKQDFLAAREEMVQMDRKVNKVREEVFQLVVCVSTAAPVLASPRHALHSSCGENAVEEKNFFQKRKRLRIYVTIQQGFVSSNYPTASDALQFVNPPCYPPSPTSYPFVSHEEDTASTAASGTEASVAMYAASGKGTA